MSEKIILEISFINQGYLSEEPSISVREFGCEQSKMLVLGSVLGYNPQPVSPFVATLEIRRREDLNRFLILQPRTLKEWLKEFYQWWRKN